MEEEYKDLLNEETNEDVVDAIENEEQGEQEESNPLDDGRFNLLNGFRGLRIAQQGLNGNTETPLTGGSLPQGYGDPLHIMQGEVDEAKKRQDEQFNTIQGLMDEYNAELKQRQEALKPAITQAELDNRRAASTNLSLITSALANIANGIAVGRGGLNATVPDGYQAAYQHWNDVQKRQSARQAEYDKLTDAIWSNRLTQAKMKYGEASSEYQNLKAQHDKAVAAKQQHLYDMEKQAQKFAYDTEKRKDEQNFKREIEENKNETTLAAARIRSRGGGGGSGSKNKNVGSLEYQYGDDIVNVEFPSGINDSQAFSKMATLVRSEISNKMNELMSGKSEFQKKKIMQSEEYKALAKLNDKIRSNSEYTSSTAGQRDIANAIEQLGISPERVAEILNRQSTLQTQQTNQQRQNNSGNGGTGASESGAF